MIDKIPGRGKRGAAPDLRSHGALIPPFVRRGERLMERRSSPVRFQPFYNVARRTLPRLPLFVIVFQRSSCKSSHWTPSKLFLRCRAEKNPASDGSSFFRLPCRSFAIFVQPISHSGKRKSSGSRTKSFMIFSLAASFFRRRLIPLRINIQSKTSVSAAAYR